MDGGTTAKYVYDVMDQRVRITTQSDDNEYLFDPFGRRQSSWIVGNNFGNEGRIYWDYGLLANRSQNGQTYFHHGNYLGTERVRTNYQGQPVDTVTSGPYGENFQQNTSDGSSTQDNNGYTSQEHDNLTGTDHFLYRQYQGTLGRWMSPDPADGSYETGDPQSLNRYAYVGNNPLGATDPLGLQRPKSCVDDDTPCAGGGGAGLQRITSNSSFTGGFGGSWNEFQALNGVLKSAMAVPIGSSATQAFYTDENGNRVSLGGGQSYLYQYYVGGFNPLAGFQAGGSVTGTPVANSPAPSKPAPTPKPTDPRPSCTALGFKAVGDAIVSTLDPTISFSTFAGAVAGGSGDLVFKGSNIAGKLGKYAPILAFAGFWANLTHEGVNAATTPCRGITE